MKPVRLDPAAREAQIREQRARVAHEQPLSAIQENAWAQRERERAAGTDVVQAIGYLPESIAAERLAAAWTSTLARHAGLRVGIRSDASPPPVQFVAEKVDSEVGFEDWSLDAPVECERRFEAWLRADRARGFALDRPPLVRLSLFRFGPDESRVVWSYHRILLDTSSAATVIHEALQPEPETRTVTEALSVPDAAGQGVTERPETEAYWRARLEGLRAPTPLGVGRDPEVSAECGAVGEVTVTVPARVADALRAIGEAEGCASLEALLEGAWALLLHRYTGEEDVCFGTRLLVDRGPGRDSPAHSVGNWTNTLPTRLRLEDSLPVRAWVRALGEGERSRFPHRRVSARRIRDWSEMQAEQPLFRSLVVLEGPGLNDRLEGGRGSGAGNFRLVERTECPVTLYARVGAELRLRLVHETDRLDEGSATRMLGHLTRLLQEIAEQPEATVEKLPMLSDSEIRQIEAWNAMRVDVPPGNVTDWIEAQTARTPERAAVTHGDRTWTYCELDRRANGIARLLRLKGLRPGSRVGLLMEPSLEMLAALLGILKAEAAYVPLDPELPGERLAFMAKDASLTHVVSEPSLREAIPASAARAPLFVDATWPDLRSEEGGAPQRSVGPNRDAYVLYTSGSTGKPKGVCVPHSALSNLLWAMRERPGMTEDDVILGTTTASFDIAALELLLPLTVGARVVLLDRAVVRDARALAEAIGEIHPTIVQATPSAWRMLVEAGWAGDPRIKVISGGEALERSLANWLKERCGAVWNGYGPTEATIYSTMHPVGSRSGPVPIGRPVANTSAYVVDSRRRILPRGVAGELALGGAGVARGYLGRPELTAEKFIRCPWAPETRLYLTGDRARLLPDGTLEYLGRTDHQVKIRGFRIEPGEIECALARHPGVRQSVVVARDDAGSGVRLVAYLVTGHGEELPIEELRAFLAATLPPYMIPASFIRLDRMPLTPNGKIDRAALPATGAARPELAAALARPQGRTERMLVGLWEDVLHVRPVGIDDNFFDLGGDSMLALRLFTRIEKRLGMRLPLATLLAAPTIATLAPHLTRSGRPRWESLVTIQAGGDRAPLFCVPGIGGNPVGYQTLGRCLGADQPLYGFQAPGLDGTTEAKTRVEDMALHYLRDLRANAFRGPYHLAGVSFGGLVAFEMARQLAERGEAVGSVALFDTAAPRAPFTQADADERSTLLRGYGARLRFHSRRVFLEPNWGRHVGRMVERLVRRVVARGWQVAYRTYERFAKRLPAAFRNVEQAGYLAERRYSPPPSPVRVQLFRATIRPVDDSGDPLIGWGRLALGGVDVIEIPADHLSILREPAADEVAVQLRRLIDETPVVARAGAGEP